MLMRILPARLQLENLLADYIGARNCEPGAIPAFPQSPRFRHGGRGRAVNSHKGKMHDLETQGKRDESDLGPWTYTHNSASPCLRGFGPGEFASGLPNPIPRPDL
jgi:hypothetical protein